MGQYRLREEYRHLKVESSLWLKMNLEQRQRKTTLFMKASVEISSSDTTAEIPLNALETVHVGKAQDLTRGDNSIVKAPGSDTAYMVRSYSNERPHYVQVLKSGNIVCDDQCLSYLLLKNLCTYFGTCYPGESSQKVFNVSSGHSTFTKFYCSVRKGEPSTAGKKAPRRGVSKNQSQPLEKKIEFPIVQRV